MTPSIEPVCDDGAPGPEKPLLVFDVSTLVGSAASRPTGVDRILIDVAAALVEALPTDELAFCAFDPFAAAVSDFTPCSCLISSRVRS